MNLCATPIPPERPHAHSGLLLVVFALTAIATSIAQLLPSTSELVALALLLDVVPFVSVIAATIIVIVPLARESRPVLHLLIAGYVYLAGGLVGALGVAHLFAVVLVAVEGEQEFVYSFRLYSLVQLGVLLIAGGFLAAVQTPLLARVERRAWRRSIVVWATLLGINLPLAPIQGFAVLFSALAVVALLLLGVMRRRFSVQAAGPWA